jgi:hypothetical protein
MQIHIPLQARTARLSQLYNDINIKRRGGSTSWLACESGCLQVCRMVYAPRARVRTFNSRGGSASSGTGKHRGSDPVGPVVEIGEAHVRAARDGQACARLVYTRKHTRGCEGATRNTPNAGGVSFRYSYSTTPAGVWKPRLSCRVVSCQSRTK